MEYVHYVLEKMNGNKSHAAKVLGVSRQTVLKWLKEEENEQQ